MNQNKQNIDGKDIYKFSDDELAIFRRRQVGLIYQFYNLIPILNVEENICLPLKLDGQKVNEKELNEMIQKLGLQGRRKNLPNELSGGQQQRVAIGRSLMQNPAILLADEPTGNLDEDTAGDITKILKESAHELNKCVIVVTHSNELASQADVILKLKRGSLHTV